MEKPVATLRSASGTPTGRLAVWWVISSEIVIFGGILMSYLMHRFGHPEWSYQAAVTNTYLGGFNTFVLLTSSLSAVLAHAAAERGDGPRAAKLLRLTALASERSSHPPCCQTSRPNFASPNSAHGHKGPEYVTTYFLGGC